MGRTKKSPGNWRQRFKRKLHDRFLLRFHMFLITAAVLLSGVMLSKLLWTLGLRTINVRYPVAVVFSYGIFFLLIRIWLTYIAQGSAGGSDALELADGDIADGVYMAVRSARGGGGVGGGGGDGEGGSSFSLGDLGDAGDEGGIVLVALAVVLVIVFGSSLYLIWEAPAMLGEAAVQMMLATSLTRATRRIDEPGWAGSIFGATWIPFSLVLVATIGFAAVASHYCPGATRMTEILHACGVQ
jgi:hypothetical protein